MTGYWPLHSDGMARVPQPEHFVAWPLTVNDRIDQKSLDEP